MRERINKSIISFIRKSTHVLSIIELYGVPIHVIYMLFLRHVGGQMFKDIYELYDSEQSIT